MKYIHFIGFFIVVGLLFITYSSGKGENIMDNSTNNYIEKNNVFTSPNVSSQIVSPSNIPLPANPNNGISFDTDNLKEIWLAGGCFWGVESYMARVYGVYDSTSGYSNGNIINPTYEDVINGSGHAETVHVKYDPKLITLEKLLGQFFEVVDPTTLNRQGNDVGISYRSGIYYNDESDLPTINNFLEQLKESSNKDIVVEVEALNGYFKAEEYHQDYLEKNPNGYCHINFDPIDTQEIPPNKSIKYSKPSDTEVKANLTDLQYKVTQKNGTERPFDNVYWDNKKEGIYVDIVSGEPLFSSATKYKSGTGWPSFFKPISNDYIVELEDNTLFSKRTEVRSKYGDSHLGHIFNDGPSDKGGLRYCINSSSLKFIPYKDMEEEGYEEWLNKVK